jgi:hypothetical protein
VAVADLTNNGKLDIITANPDTGVSVLLGDGKGGFPPAPGSPFMTASGPQSVAVGDFNGDGKLDLAVACFQVINGQGGQVSVFLGNGDGTFQPYKNYLVGSDPFSVVTGDFNRDGKLDLAVGDHGGPGVSVLLGNGDGTFQPQTVYPIQGGLLTSLAEGDLRGNGKLDLVTANPAFSGLPATQPGATVSVLLGNGDGTFQSAANIPVPSNPVEAILGDFNGDGRLDVATANSDNTVSVLLGNGDGTFAPPRNSAVGGPALALAAADFNGDRRLDLVVANGAQNTVSVLLGNGDGTFRAPLTLPAGGNQSNSVAAGDFNRDSLPDLAVGNFFSNDVGVLLNQGFPHNTANGPYVTQLYADLLDRPPDAGGLAYFTAVLDQSLASRAQVVLAIENSLEYLTDEVEQVYAKFLGRAADPAGLTYWVGVLEQGGTRAQVEAQILGSEEYFAVRGSATDDGFLLSLYTQVLDRPADAAGLEGWESLLSCCASRADIAAAVLASPESAADEAQSLYQTYLHRAPDPGGLAAFTSALEQGLPIELAIAIMLESDEYFAAS